MRRRPLHAVLTAPLLAILGGACAAVTADPAVPAGRVLFHDDFAAASRGERGENVVQLPPPVGLGYATTVPYGFRPTRWIVSDTEPDRPRRSFWIIPPNADYMEQAGRSHNSVAFAATPVPPGTRDYDVVLRQFRWDNDYIGFVVGAPAPRHDHAGVEFGYETQLPGTDETVPDAYLSGALGSKRIPGAARTREWVTHTIEVRGPRVRWLMDGTLLAEADVQPIPTGGYFGIRQRYDRGTRYDDVRIVARR